MATITHWLQSAFDRLDRPLAFLVVALFLLVLRRAERQRRSGLTFPWWEARSSRAIPTRTPP